MADQFHRHNHYIPRLYLKPWTISSGKVWTYRVLVEHENVPVWKPFSSKAVANHAHLYTQIAAGEETDQIEKWFDREFESPAEESIRKAISDRRLTRDDWKHLVRFLALQDVRTPAWLAQRMKSLDETAPQLLEEVMENSIQRIREAKETGKTVERSNLPEVEREGFPLRVTVRRLPSGGGEIGAELLRGRQYWLWAIKRALTRNATVLLQHRWTILKPSKGATWITSDNPVMRMNYSSRDNYNFDGGWNSRGTCIVLPLGPEHLLYTQIGEPMPQRGERMTKENTDLVRRFIAEHAWRMIFAAKEEEQVSSLRPRIVNPAEVQYERQQWANWHEQQTSAEREMMNATNPNLFQKENKGVTPNSK
jgi:hypothetical protein